MSALITVSVQDTNLHCSTMDTGLLNRALCLFTP